MKRLKHKQKYKPQKREFCAECKEVDVTDDDPEMEYVCVSCRKILHDKYIKTLGDSERNKRKK